MDYKCFENSAELLEFFYAHEKEIVERYKQLTKTERNPAPMRQKVYAYAAAGDIIVDNGMKATDCQIDKMAELIVFGAALEKSE